MGYPSKRPPRKDLTLKRNAKRNALGKAVDAHIVVREVAKGKTYQEVADMLNKENGYSLSRTSVQRMVQEAIMEWKRENMGNIDAVIGRELARIEMLEDKVMEDYEKSKNLRAVDYAALLKRGFKIDEIDEMFKDKTPGNPQFIEAMLHCQMQKLKVLGIDKGYDVPTNTIVNYNFGALNEAQLAAMADKLQDAKAAELMRELAVDEQTVE